MDSLYDLLASKNFDEPPEIQKIKQYVRDAYRTDVGVSVRDRDIIVTVPSAALAGKLRFEAQKLKEVAGTEKRLVFRIQR